MQEELFDVYNGVVGNLAKRLCLLNEVDTLVNDFNDYRSILQLESLKLQTRFRELHGFNVDAEHRYVCKGLWNYCMDTYKARCRRSVGMTFFKNATLAGIPPASTRKKEMEYRIEAKNAIELLKKSLLPEDMKLLQNWAFCDCRIEEDIRGKMTKAQMKYRIKLLRAKAKRILINNI